MRKNNVKWRRIVSFLLVFVFGISGIGNVASADEAQDRTSDMSVATAADAEEADIADDLTDFNTYLEQKTVQGVIYLCHSYDIKKSADSQSEAVVSAPSGTSVILLDLAVGQDGIWYHVKAAVNDAEYEGYVEREYLAISDEGLLELESQFPVVYAAQSDEMTVAMSDIEYFPESYRSALYELRSMHPNWVFVRQDTGLDWNYVISEETKGSRSLIGTYRGENWKNEIYSDGWAYASADAVRYYMDPRNFLMEDNIFQFEQLTYNASFHTVEATQKMLDKTFMSSIMPGTTNTYAENIVGIGAGLQVSPFHLASRLAQEQGSGTSPLISGTYQGYEGYYNYFNIAASGATDKEIYENGLSYAKNQGWTSPYLSIQGGAKVIAQNYILCGQDTLYLQKFDVEDDYYGLFSHQYMQNIEAPASEGRRTAKAYRNVGVFDNRFVFKIPVYNNMPDKPCLSPDEGIKSAGIYLMEYGGERVTAGLVVNANSGLDLEYRWLIYDIKSDVWRVQQDWVLNNEWFSWKPSKSGAYLIQAEVRVRGEDKSVISVIGYNHVSEDDVYIKGKCQMPYSGAGGGYLIGVETNKNPNQELRYELLILDCTLLAEGKPAWIWSTGKNKVSDGNAFWAVWQPKYGYYWTMFRIYDSQGNLLDEECYGFENIS